MPDLFSTLGQNAQKTLDSTTFGTRDLVFLQISTTENLGTNYTDPGSNFFKLVQCLQQTIEIYGVGIPSGNSVTVVANRQTVPYGDGEEANAGGRVQALRSLINAHPALSNADVYQGKINGWTIQNDC